MIQWDTYHGGSKNDGWHTAWQLVTARTATTYVILEPDRKTYKVHRWPDRVDLAGPFYSLEAAKTAYLMLMGVGDERN